MSVVIWIMALLSTSPRLFEVSYDVSRSEDLCCTWNKISGTRRTFTALTQLVLNIVIPSGIMLGIYLHMLFKTRIPKNRVLPSDRALRTRQGRTRMVRIALLSMLSCWLPYQVLHLLSSFGVTEMNFTTYHWTTALVFVTSCTNPFIYGVTNSTYRRGYFEIALGCCPVKVHGFLSRHLSLSQTHHAAILVQSIHGRLRPVSAPQTLRQSIILDLNP
ncbi:pyroglutamylated RFamide peptide receptor-like [Orbicella faveolata]|uniref:pyroglutamylated RFamide peptide receptor-like n=1 Tax=Orbicella faveolata TaxID=48498 RepID=UPI0009E49FCB|nr:pyroglutamylated RFamide peptide receptor-like [Orbicella faveolata]